MILVVLYMATIYVTPLGTSLLCLFFHLLCYALVLKFFTYYAQYYAHVKD